MAMRDATQLTAIAQGTIRNTGSIARVHRETPGTAIL
jgi:hypothetical protein